MAPRPDGADATLEIPRPCFDHVRRLTSPHGIWEHARYLTPRPEHGLCLDDNARALIVTACEQDPDLEDLSRIYLEYLIEASLDDGGLRDRRDANGAWREVAGSGDSHGRALWALGTVARIGLDQSSRDLGSALFQRHAALDTVALRPFAFAMLGASELLAAHPGHRPATRLLLEGAQRIRPTGERWPWPEPRLRYDNARLPEALIAGGTALSDEQLLSDGLGLLEWLVSMESREGRFSFTPTRGWGPGEPRPGFDQQPVEAGAMADACLRAWQVTGDPVWRDRLLGVVRWLLGDNDGEVSLYDRRTGGCRDGLTADGANLNQGAESTLSAIMALQCWASVA